MPIAGCNHSDVLHVARQVRRSGHVDDVALEKAQRRKTVLEENITLGKGQGRDRGGGA